MNEQNNGGPAFPQHGFDEIAERFTSQGGMTLRDYFAAKAMEGLYASNANHDHDDADIFNAVAMAAYKQADAMLKARQA